MRRGMMAVLGTVMLSWSGTGLAASLAERALAFEGSFTSPGTASLHLMPAGDQGGGGAVKMDDQIRSLLAVALTFFVGFGVGHFVVGDSAAWLFLGLDVGLTVIPIGLGVLAFLSPALLYGLLYGGGTFAGLLYFLAVAMPAFALVAIAVRIWQLVDILFKSGLVGGGPKTSEVILPRGGELARSAFQPAMANGLNLRF